MTLLRTRARFQPDPVIEAFPGLLTFRGAPPDTQGVKEIEGPVDPGQLETVVRRVIRWYDPDQPSELEIETDTAPTVKARHPYRTRIAAAFASGVVLTVVAEQIVRWL